MDRTTFVTYQDLVPIIRVQNSQIQEVYKLLNVLIAVLASAPGIPPEASHETVSQLEKMEENFRRTCEALEAHLKFPEGPLQ
jgi:hypothetical protein